MFYVNVNGNTLRGSNSVIFTSFTLLSEERLREKSRIGPCWRVSPFREANRKLKTLSTFENYLLESMDT